MASSAPNRQRVTVDGKFFRLGEKKFHLKGVTYGPFAPHDGQEHFAAPEQTAKDFAQIRELGANLIRVYYTPPIWLLDLASQYELKVMVDIPWSKHVCFLDQANTRQEAREAVRRSARACAHHPAVFALSVVNEIPPDVVRWTGAQAVADFIDELVLLVKEIAPECLCTFGNYPPTEYLRPQYVDFFCFNVYLHNPRPFENYLARLQMQADVKPLVMGEFGIDSLHEGQAKQAEILSWQIETAFRGGLAGAIVFSFTDDWFKNNGPVTDWAFGLTTRDRQPKPAFAAVQTQFTQAPHFPLAQSPSVSVVVASYNGARTLKTCLESLERLNYPDYEIVLVDDGSTDVTPQIAAQFPRVRYFRCDQNQGLSAARNLGIDVARGEIVAFTDSDCRADEDWLYYLVSDLMKGRYAGIGGHNFLPPDDSSVAAAVMVSPGGPAHVMLTDRLAEHIPGCNMAFYKWALLEIGVFDPVFRKAGDDVDVCWRIQQRGYKIGFSPAGFVWHYRRSTVRDYLKQQAGYGEAEALLVRKHPDYFNWVGGSIWQGRIYSPAKFGIVTHAPMIYRGLFGTGLFQTLYTPSPTLPLMLLTSLEYYVLITLPLLVLGVVVPQLIPLGITSLVVSAGMCIAAASQAEIPRNKRRLWSRPLVALLFALQPIVRGWARYRGRLRVHRIPLESFENLNSLSIKYQDQTFDEVRFWDERGLDRTVFLRAVLERLERAGWQSRSDGGWSDFDVEIFGTRWSRLQLTTVAEAHGDGRQLLRCRLKPAWTFLGRIIFWSGLGLQLLILGVAGKTFPWLWLMLLSLPVAVWWLRQEQRDLQRLVALFLENVAGQMKLTKVQPNAIRVPVPPKPQ